jgi:hypothetical protein
MKLFALILISLLCSHCSFAQSAISIGPQLGFASNFSSSAKMDVGGSIEYTGQFSEHIGARFYTGYDRFKGKYFADDAVSFVPIRAGLQGFLYKDIFSVYVDAGVASYHAKGSESHKTNFSYAFGAAYQIPLRLDQQFVQVSGYYNYYKFSQQLNYTWYNIRLAYGFRLGHKNSGEK